MKLGEAMDRFLEAIIKKVEPKDIRKKLEFLTSPEHKESMSDLTPAQLDAIAGMIQIGNMYDTMAPLKDFALLYASWSPSRDGKRAQDVVKVMMQVAPEQPQNVTTIHTGSQQGGESGETK